MRVIGHGGLLREFSLARSIRGSGHVWGIYPRYAQTAGDLGFAVQFNARAPICNEFDVSINNVKYEVILK